MKLALSTLIFLLAQSHHLFAQELQISATQLKQLEQKTQTIVGISQYAGSDLLATAMEATGQSYVFTSPINVQRAIYLKPKGSMVEKGEVFMTLLGPEVHHYYSQFQMQKQLYKQSKSLFENNQKLFEKRSLNESAWLDITRQFYDIKLSYDEYLHFFEYVSKIDEKNDSLSISAPISGAVSFDESESINTGNILARFTPSDALRLKVNTVFDNTETLISIDTGTCTLAIESYNKQVDGFYQGAWSAPLTPDCQINLGEPVRVTPFYQVEAYLLNKESVFEWEGQHHVFVKSGAQYLAIEVELIATQGKDYVVKSEQSLANKEVLVSSVSAAQGILMGLGE